MNMILIIIIKIHNHLAEKGIKKSAAMMLALLMVFSCLVFAAPKAKAGAAGSYYVKVTYQCVKNANSFLNWNGSLDGTYVGWKEGATSPTESNDTCGIIIGYKEINGTETNH